MPSLTTRQRDILHILLETNQPLGAAEIADQMSLSPRQVNYSLRGVKSWLAHRDIKLQITPGVGVKLVISPEQSSSLFIEIGSKSRLQLILSADERRQLLALVLLNSDDPLILQHLQCLAQVSRSTIMHDLDEIESWLQDWDISLVRKPNYGVLIEAPELNRQQALGALTWGEMPFGDPLAQMTYTDGLQFSLREDSLLLPLVLSANQIFKRWNTSRVVGIVALAEEQLGGRFSDEAVLHLSLALAILSERVASGYHLEIGDAILDWLRSLPIWTVARLLAKRLGWSPTRVWQTVDIAGIAMYLLSAPRNEIFPSDLERQSDELELIEALLARIATAFNQSTIRDDRTLRNGLVNHIIPACMRQRFGLWFPSLLEVAGFPEKFELEMELVRDLAGIVKQSIGIQLPENEIINLAMLLRAAQIRLSPYRFGKVIVICPSGMATAQLLVARLEARFPRLGTIEVVSLREITRDLVQSADLILSTVPLSKNIIQNSSFIQVHPLLLPEDINAITRFLS